MPGYYRTEDLATFSRVAEGAPAPFQAFLAWNQSIFQDGALSSRDKELIAIAVAHALQCPYCIDVHTHAGMKAGATVEQMTEAVQVAAVIRAGATLTHAMQMREIVQPTQPDQI